MVPEELLRAYRKLQLLLAALTALIGELGTVVLCHVLGCF